MKQTLLLIILITFLTACAPVSPPIQLAPTQTPVEEVAQPTPDTEPPTEQESQPAPTLPANQEAVDPEAQPVQPEPESQPAEVPEIPGTAEIAILRPGQYSRLTSPIRLIASFSDEADTLSFITLYGEDGRILAERKFEILPYDDPVNGNVITDLEFKIEGMNEVGHLEFKTFDQSGRLRALNSVGLILLSGGTRDRNYAPEDGERILQQIPFPGQTKVEGGQLFLSGLVRFTQETQNTDPAPLTVELVDESGKLISEGRAPVILSPGSLIGQYVAEIEYQVTGSTPILLTISVQEGRFQGPSYLKTFPLTLYP